MEQATAPAANKTGTIIAPQALVAALISAVLLAGAGFVPDEVNRAVNRPGFFAVGMAAEFAGIVLSYMIFAAGWYGYKQNRNTQDLYVAAVFWAVGALGIVHALSYPSMPSLLSANTISKMSAYWIFARLFEAGAILGAAYVSPNSKKTWMRPVPLVAAATAVAVVVTAFVGFFYESLPPSLVLGVGSTPYGPALHYGVAIALVLAAVAFSSHGRGGRRSIDYWQTGLVLDAAGVLAFASYHGAFGPLALTGSVLRAAGYYFILRGLVASSLEQPHEELVSAREQLAALVSEARELYEQADSQRAQLEKSFVQIGEALESSLEIRDRLGLIGELAADMTGADAAAVAVRDEKRPVLGIVASRGLAEEEVEIPLEGSLAAEAIQQGAPKWSGDTPPGGRPWRPELVSGAVASSLNVPMVMEGRALGVLSLYSSKPHAFSKRQADLVTTFAEQAAVAVDNAGRYARERRIAQTFQRGLLPELPDVEGWDLAARYEPASKEAEVGGDLYDAILLDATHLALAIGDVSGKGLGSAAIMASTQYMMRGFLFQGMSPGEILSGLNSALSRELDVTQFVTIFVSILNLRSGEFLYADAGHPFPVFMTPEGTRLLSGGNGGPVGAFGSGGYVTDRLWLGKVAPVAGKGGRGRSRERHSAEVGLLMYTDGLLEARSNGELLGDSRVVEMCNANRRKRSDELLDTLLEEAKDFSSGRLGDDIAMLALKCRAR